MSGTREAVWRRTRARLRELGTLAVWLAIVSGTLLIASARWFWLGELATGFAWYFGWAALVGAAVLGLIGHPRSACLALVLSAWHLWPELSLWLPNGEEREHDPGAELTVASCNLFWWNHDHAAFLEWLEGSEPDLVFLSEVSRPWLPVLEAIAARYPRQFSSPAIEVWTEADWGRVILSRLPITRGLETAPRLVEVDVAVGGRRLLVRGAHPPRPGKASSNERRDAVLGSLAEMPWDGSSLLLGDLNVTSTSPVFRDLLRKSGLRDSRQGFGRQPSYCPRELPLGIAIDHVLVGDGLVVLERRTDELRGSDHRIVVARIGLR